MRIGAIRVLAFAAAVALLSACGGGGGSSGGGAQTGLSSTVDDAPGGSIGASQKVTLLNATPEELSEAVVACQGGNPHVKKVCVSVCHRPPGNPTKGKNMVLPLSAISAHLRHGGHPDELGVCTVAGDDDGSGGTDDGSGGTDDGSGGTDGGDDLPQWCQMNLAIDADCDGINDASGEPMY